MKKLFKAFAITMCLGFATNVFADLSAVRIGAPSNGGAGCPAGTLQAALNGSGLSIYFDRFYAEISSSGPRMASVSCNLAIPVHIPAGYSLSIESVKLKGQVGLEKNAKAIFSSEYFFAGSKGVKLEKIYTGAISSDVVITSALLPNARIWSVCGQDTILRVNTSILLSATKLNDSAYALIDSAQMEPSVHYQFSLKKCK